jgi:hypothetical protein
LSVESSTSSHIGEPIVHSGTEGAIPRAEVTAVTVPGTGLRILARSSLATEATAPSKPLTIGEVLRLWRAAERLLDITDVDSPEYESTVADVAELRAHYQRLFDARQREE